MELGLSDIHVNLDINSFLCPITQCIFNDPVIANDGHVYEKEAILMWFESNETSPTTGKAMTNELNECHIVKYIIEMMIKQYPNLKEHQFKKDNRYITNVSYIKEYIRKGNYYKLLDFVEYNFISLVDNEILINILSHSDDKIVLHVIDNLTNNYNEEYGRYRFMTYIFLHSKQTIIKYMIDKNVDLDYTINSKIYGKRLLNVLISRKFYDLAKYVIQKGITINTNDSSEIRMIKSLCSSNDEEMLLYLLNNNLNIHEINNDDNDMTSLHYTCKCSFLEATKFIVNKEVDIEAEMNLGWRPLHVASYYGSYELIEFIIKQRPNFNAKIKKFMSEDSSYDCRDLINLNKQLSDKDKIKLLILIDSTINNIIDEQNRYNYEGYNDIYYRFEKLTTIKHSSVLI